MSLTTYANLQNQVKSFLHRASLLDAAGADNIPDLIRLGELWIFRRARTREMETALSVAISAGAAAVPSDYADLKHARIDGSPGTPLKLRPTQWIYENYPLRSSSGTPKFIGVDGSNFIFGPYPSSNGTLVGIYYAKPTSIATSANSLFVANPDLYLYAALSACEVYIKNDKRVEMWMQMRNQILADMNQEAKDSAYGDGMDTVVG